VNIHALDRGFHPKRISFNLISWGIPWESNPGAGVASAQSLRHANMCSTSGDRR